MSIRRSTSDTSSAAKSSSTVQFLSSKALYIASLWCRGSNKAYVGTSYKRIGVRQNPTYTPMRQYRVGIQALGNRILLSEDRVSFWYIIYHSLNGDTAPALLVVAAVVYSLFCAPRSYYSGFYVARYEALDQYKVRWICACMCVSPST